MHKVFWTRDELPNADYLLSVRQALLDDFVRGYDSLSSAIKAHTKPVLDRRHLGIPLETTAQWAKTKNKPNFMAWRFMCFKYERHDNFDLSFKATDAIRQQFPTAWNLISKYGEDCPIANYSVLAPNSVIEPHIDPENHTREYIRVHIPLSIPIGDCWFEAGGQRTDWSDIWAFDNQFEHSAHNNTNEWRLVFLIDFKRSKLGIADYE